jgi:cystathionine beta-lyase
MDQPRSLADYLDPTRCPPERPGRELFSPRSLELHDAIDRAARRAGFPYLHPEDPTLQLDMLGSRRMRAWQERKAERLFGAEACWSDLEQFYARYGVETTRRLLAAVRELEHAAGAVLTDCGMQAVALSFDILARRGGHAVLLRGVYNKTRRYLEWLGNRLGFEVSIVDEGDYDGLASALRENSFLIFAETYTNPLLRAIDPGRIGRIVVEARKRLCPQLRLIIDDTIATPWGLKRPLLEHEGIDIVVASGTKALAGQDRDLWGYVASNRIDFLNEVMDLEAMRGGILDWRRAEAIGGGLAVAKERFLDRCRSAGRIAEFLARHPRVEAVFHPSRPEHPDRETIARDYSLPASLLSFRIRGADEDAARRFADVLATFVLLRYAGSFDGLSTKINHHRTVSEYFTPVEDLEKAGIDRVLRLGVGLEAADDIIACLNWALWHFERVSEAELAEWQERRATDLGIREGA